MAIIIQIETATQVCSAAVSENGKTIALKEESASNIHASRLTLFIKEVMDTAGLQFAEVDAVAVSKGPGSYTGLRIGVSTAKGLCFALDKPLIAIGTLQMMAAGFVAGEPDFTGLVCPMIDARRMEVFTAVYDIDLNEVVPVTAKIIDEGSFAEVLELSNVRFLGDGSEKCRAALNHKNATFSDINFNSAGNMSKLSYEAFTMDRFVDVAYFEPFYLKDFVFTTPKKR